MRLQAPQTGDLLPTWDSSFMADVKLDIRQTNPNDSDKSVADTVALMGTHANNACSSQQIKEALQQAGINNSTNEDEAIRKIFHWIKGEVTFIQDEDHLRKMFYDPESKELLITPPALLSMSNPSGDCDDFSMLACAMLMAKGVKCDFVTVAANSSFPREFSHIYCMVATRDGRNIPFDASHGKKVGWETARAFRKQVWPVFNWTNGLSRMGGGRNGKGGMGMVIDGSRASFDTRFKRGLMGLILNNGMGDVDCTTDDDGNVSCSTDVTSTPLMTGVTNVDPSTGIPYDVELNSSSGSTSSSSSSSSAASASTNNLLNSIFNSVSSIVKQVTQQPGTQSTTCNPLTGVCTTSSTVLPTAAQAAAGVSLVSSSLGSILPTLLLIGVGIFALDELGKH
jgi:hypothetical protein